MKINVNTCELTLERLKDKMAKAFPEDKVKITGWGPGKRVMIQRGTFKGVEVFIRKDGLVVNGSFMPSTIALLTFALGCVAGFVTGLVIGFLIQRSGNKMLDEVAGALKRGAPRGQMSLGMA